MISETQLKSIENYYDNTPAISPDIKSDTKLLFSEIRRQRRIIKALKKLVERLKDAQFTSK